LKASISDENANSFYFSKVLKKILNALTKLRRRF